ncbi:MAG: hypothetical protein JNN10_16190 [Sphingopyxis sp.]|uniref:hypothetical protein n=1 Tax=Sphingopyxis sp. TaxID=1908224 RepID=UPI001A60082F|nr:hypothetical protein [Sphingopyxis sp.]MBL9067822.1 hypothetical protein [Sphingopyxis sp.]
MTSLSTSLRDANPVASASPDRRDLLAAADEGQASSSPLVTEGEGAFLIFRPLADLSLSSASPALVTGRAGLPQILEARPVHSIAETHLGKLPC